MRGDGINEGDGMNSGRLEEAGGGYGRLEGLEDVGEALFWQKC